MGSQNERRDAYGGLRLREVKLRLYSLKGVLEYWIVNWQLQQIEVYRRDAGQLRLLGTLIPTTTWFLLSGRPFFFK